MAKNVPDLTLAEHQIVEIISRTDMILADVVSCALEEAAAKGV